MPGCLVQRPFECLARLVVYAAVAKAFNARLMLAPGYGLYAGAQLPKCISAARLAPSAGALQDARLPSARSAPGCPPRPIRPVASCGLAPGCLPVARGGLPPEKPLKALKGKG